MEMSKRQCKNLFFVLMVAVAVFRFLYYGLSYTPYLDDYTQYLYYPQLPNNWQIVYAGGAGVLCSRPLAGILDLWLWSRFWGRLGLAVGIISFLHGLSAVFFCKAFNKCGLKVGALFMIIYILMPINCEATYWLSASSRIVVSMFLVSLGAYFAANKRVILFFLFNFLSMWFYEQTAVLGFVVSVWICIKQKRWNWLVLPLVSAIALAMFYLKYGGLGDNAHRIAMTDVNGVWNGTVKVLYDFFKTLTIVQFRLITKGFARGFVKLALDFSVLWLVVLTTFALLFYKLSQTFDGHKGAFLYDIGIGLILMLVPIVPFFVIREAAFNLRNVVPCVLGFAIVLDRAVSIMPYRCTCVLGAVLMFCFSVVSVSEVGDYNFTAKQDLKLATQIAERVNEETAMIEVKIKTPEYYPQNAPFRDHIMSMTGSDWGMTGIVRTISGNRHIIVVKI